MHRIHSICLAAAFLTLLAGVPAAHGELNLWISYHFTGEDNYGTGDYRDAEVLLQSALEETRSSFRRANTLDDLGRVYTALGEFDAAEKYLGEALSLKERALGRNHREVATTLNNIADLRYIQGKTETVEGLYRRALDINERDQLNIEVCRSLNGLALLHNDAGEYVEAEELLKRAVQINEKAHRRDHPYMATVLVNLGILYTNLERYKEAEPMFERASYIQGAMLRPNHPDVAVRLHATAVLYDSTERRAEALKLAKEAEAIRAKQSDKGDLY